MKKEIKCKTASGLGSERYNEVFRIEGFIKNPTKKELKTIKV